MFLFVLFFSFNSKHMNAYIEDILSRIQDLLALTPPVSVVRAHTLSHTLSHADVMRNSRTPPGKRFPRAPEQRRSAVHVRDGRHPDRERREPGRQEAGAHAQSAHAAHGGLPPTAGQTGAGERRGEADCTRRLPRARRGLCQVHSHTARYNTHHTSPTAKVQDWHI